MDKRTRTILIIGGLAVAAYLGYRWWQNRQSGGSGTGLGTNLNSIAPALIAGSSGPMSGLQYTGGAMNFYVSQPITQSSTTSNSTVKKGAGGLEPWQVNPGGLRK